MKLDDGNCVGLGWLMIVNFLITLAMQVTEK